MRGDSFENMAAKSMLFRFSVTNDPFVSPLLRKFYHILFGYHGTYHNRNVVIGGFVPEIIKKGETVLVTALNFAVDFVAEVSVIDPLAVLFSPNLSLFFLSIADENLMSIRKVYSTEDRAVAVAATQAAVF